MNKLKLLKWWLASGLTYSQWKQQQANLSLYYDHQILTGVVLPAFNPANSGLGILASNQYPESEELDQSGTGVMDKDNYASSSGGVLTNPTLDILQVETVLGDGAGQAVQTILAKGVRHVVSGEYLAEAGATASLNIGISTPVTLGTAATFTSFEVERTTGTGANDDVMFFGVVGVDKFVQFRKLSVRKANPLNGDIEGMALGYKSNLPIDLMVTGDGGTTYEDTYSTEHDSILLPTQFLILLWIQKDTWATTERDILSYIVDSNNYIKIGTTTVAGQLIFEFKAGGTAETILLATGSPTDVLQVGISVKSGVMRAWYNGVQTGGDQAVAGTFTGNFVSMVLGARNTTPTHVHLGRLSDVQEFSDEDSDQILEDYQKGAGL